MDILLLTTLSALRANQNTSLRNINPTTLYTTFDLYPSINGFLEGIKAERVTELPPSLDMVIYSSDIIGDDDIRLLKEAKEKGIICFNLVAHFAGGWGKEVLLVKDGRLKSQKEITLEECIEGHLEGPVAVLTNETSLENKKTVMKFLSECNNDVFKLNGLVLKLINHDEVGLAEYVYLNQINNHSMSMFDKFDEMQLLQVEGLYTKAEAVALLSGNNIRDGRPTKLFGKADDEHKEALDLATKHSELRGASVKQTSESIDQDIINSLTTDGENVKSPTTGMREISTDFHSKD